MVRVAIVRPAPACRTHDLTVCETAGNIVGPDPARTGLAGWLN